MPCSLWWHPSHTFSCVFPLTWVCVLCPLTAPGHSADTESAINKCSLNERNSCISIPHLNLVSKKWSCRRNCRRWPPACLNFSYFVSIGIFFSFDSKAMFLLNKEMNQLPVFSKIISGLPLSALSQGAMPEHSSIHTQPASTGTFSCLKETWKA